MVMANTISIVIPAKNEAATIGALLEAVRAQDLHAEIIVVDDGSTDETRAICERANVKIIANPYSKGNGAAIKAGARAAAASVIVFMDGDGQHKPEDIPRLIKKIDDGYDMVVGARQSGSQASVGRGLANRFYNWLASYMTGHKVEDLTSGFRAVRAEKFREFLYLLPNGFSYPTTSTMAFFRAGHSVAYEPIVASRRIGRSHIKLVKDGARFFLIIFKIGALYSPLKIFFPIAFLFFTSGFFLYVYNYIVQSRLTNMSMLLMISGVFVFLIGLISEQITSLMYKDSDG